MIDVKDEVLVGEPLFRITDKNGKILYDELKIEQITPAFQEGTPLNKVLFDSIKKDIDSRLLTSNKSTTEQAFEGIDDITYMTPLKTFQAITNGCKVIKNNVDITKSNQNYSINVDNYVTSNTLFVEITAYIESAGSVKWNLKEDSYTKGISFSAEGNVEIINEPDNIYITSGEDHVSLKIIADIKNGFAFIFSCSYYSLTSSTIGSSGVFEMLKIVKFAEGTFGTLDFKTDTSSNINSTFQIKEFKTI